MPDISNILSFIDWRTFFDVPIIAMMIFILYRTLKSSGSWRIGVGIIMILLLYLLARIFRFSGIEWIFNNLSNIALIGLIIIFQPEIRRIFERTAATLRVRKLLSEGSHYSFIISEAVFQIAANAWGAIIILPGRDSLADKISGGTELNARLSVPLIVSIFDHHSPGHDGAMIIENGMASRFGLRLPLSTSRKLKNEFGTRHHASMGLAEVSDAFIITVSEERGVISVFHEGEYDLIENNLELQERIEEHWKSGSSFAPVTRMPSGRRGILVIESAVSVMAAFVLWISIMMNVTQRKEMALTVPIEYKLGQKTVIVGDKPLSSRIKISGISSEMEAIRPESIKAVIDLTRVSPGTVTIPMVRRTMNLPVSVNLVDAEPSEVTVKLHSYVQMDISIKPQLIGSLPEGYELKSVEVGPRSLPVMFTGDRNAGDEFFLSTTPIYLQTITEDTKMLSKIIAPPDMLPADGRDWPDAVVAIKLVKTGVKSTTRGR
jgi:uncharacterized protein (TIGR00159 family)